MSNVWYIRDLRPGEVSVVERVFAGLSDHSRYLRFHAATPRLTAGLRTALAAVDGGNRVALVAEDRDGEPIGIVRLVQVRPGHGEMSLEVVDAAHRQGVGTALLRAASARAAALGVRTIEGSVLAGNRPMLQLLKRRFATASSFSFDGPAVHVDLQVGRAAAFTPAVTGR